MCNNKSKSAYIFPGITNIENMRAIEHEMLQKWISPYYDFLSVLLSIDIKECISGAGYKKLTGIDSQIIGYAVSCAVYDFYVKKRGVLEYVSGYSVGMFSAFYAARSISFISGVTFLHKLNKVIYDLCLNEEPFAMVSVVGLTKDQFLSVIGKRMDVDIVNQNSDVSMVISGKESMIKELEDDVFDAGALFFKRLPVERPYHATFLTKCKEAWLDSMKNEEVRDPLTPVISPTTRQILRNRKDCIYEIENNFCSPFSWFETLKQMWDLGIRDMYECGAGNDLEKIGKYSGLEHKYHRFI